MVKDLREKGLTLAEIAHELGWSLSKVNSRANIKYAPKGPNKISRKKALLDKLDEIRAKRKKNEEEIERRSEEVNYPRGRSDEDLDEYRERRDKKAEDKLSMENDPMLDDKTKSESNEE